MKKIISVRSNGTRRVLYDFSGEKSMTDKSFAKDCDVNLIMARFLKGQQITHLAKNPGKYADVSEIPDLSTALNTVTKAQEAFNDLPAQVRKRFGNSPVAMVEFMSDPKNYAEAEKLGLLKLTPSPSSLGPALQAETKPSGRGSPQTTKKTSKKQTPNDDDLNDDD